MSSVIRLFRFSMVGFLINSLCLYGFRVMKKALVMTSRIVDYTGSEILAIEVATTLSKLGYSVSIYANFFDVKKFYEECSRFIVLKFVPDVFEFDFVWAQHFMLPNSLYNINEGRFSKIVYACLSPFEPMEFTGLRIASSIGAKIVANSRETADHIKSKYMIKDVYCFNNACPEYFRANSLPSETLRRILVVSNHPPDELLIAMRILNSHGVSSDVIGGGGVCQRVTPELIGMYDAVVTIGKTVQYSILSCRPVYVYDYFSGPGWLSDFNFSAAESKNFSGRCVGQKKPPSLIAEEILFGYSAARIFISNFSESDYKRYSLELHLKILIQESSPIGMHTISDSDFMSILNDEQCRQEAISSLHIAKERALRDIEFLRGMSFFKLYSFLRFILRRG